MECRKAEYLLHGYLDGELELLGSYEFERHLEECRPCAERLAKERALRERFAGTSLRFCTPADLQRKIAAEIDASESAPAAVPRRRVRWAPWVVSGAAAVVALMSIVTLSRIPSSDALLARQVCDGHVRSLLGSHLNDVESSDQHTVKPWFAGRLDFAPSIADLSDDGFPLQGGRLDYIDGRRVAAIVYKRREHVINLFLWPATDGGTRSPRLVRQHNYQMYRWTADGLTWWAVSDLNAAELADFVALVQNRAAQRQP
jgi:anti-sigma factor RsiW